MNLIVSHSSTTRLYLEPENAAEAYQLDALYAMLKDKPVAIERKLGEGDIVSLALTLGGE